MEWLNENSWVWNGNCNAFFAAMRKRVSNWKDFTPDQQDTLFDLATRQKLDIEYAVNPKLSVLDMLSVSEWKSYTGLDLRKYAGRGWNTQQFDLLALALMDCLNVSAFERINSVDPTAMKVYFDGLRKGYDLEKYLDYINPGNVQIVIEFAISAGIFPFNAIDPKKSYREKELLDILSRTISESDKFRGTEFNPNYRLDPDAERKCKEELKQEIEDRKGEYREVYLGSLNRRMQDTTGTKHKFRIGGAAHSAVAKGQSEVGYHPQPVDTSAIVLSQDLMTLVEKVAENVHDVWAAGRIKEGWRYGEVKDSNAKTSPCLVPYSKLPESEKEYDRNTALETIKMIIKLGYKIEPASGGIQNANFF